jgi:hypothetical protein
MTRTEYETIKVRYHTLGRRYRHEKTEALRKEYLKAKQAYHRAGEQLRKQRESAD